MHMNNSTEQTKHEYRGFRSSCNFQTRMKHRKSRECKIQIVRARALSISQKWLCVNQGGQALTAKTSARSYNGILYTDHR